MIAFLLAVALTAPILLLPAELRDYLTDDMGQIDIRLFMNPASEVDVDGITYHCWYTGAEWVGYTSDAVSETTFMHGKQQAQGEWTDLDAFICAGQCHA